jgi:acyl dehydratase
MTEAATKTFAELAIGEEARFSVHMTPDVVSSFAKLSGDLSPMHTDPEYASQTSFGHVIPHGMIAGLFFSRLVGMHLPGKYALYLTQTLRFHMPLPMEGAIEVYGRITEKSEATRTIKLITEARDPSTSAVLVVGDAIVKVGQ